MVNEGAEVKSAFDSDLGAGFSNRGKVRGEAGDDWVGCVD